MSLPDLVMHRIVHYVLDATETPVTNTLSDDATEGRGYVWSLNIFLVNKTLYAHAKAVWESNHFVLVSCNSTSFFYQFQQYEIPTAAHHFVSWMVEDRKHKLKCHLHIGIDIDATHISALEKQQYDPRQFHLFDLDEDEASDRVPTEVSLPAASRIFFVLCHQDLPDFVRALREIDIAFTCRSDLRFDLQTLSSGAPLPPRTQHLLLDPFRIIRTLPGQCTLAGAIDKSLAKEFMDHLTSTSTWTSARAPSDIYYLTSNAIEQADKEFMQGNLDRAGAIFNEAADHWQTLMQTLPSMFDEKSESDMVKSFLYALSAIQARLNLETTVRTTQSVAPKSTRQGPLSRIRSSQRRDTDQREFMWTIEDFGNARDSIAEEGFSNLMTLHQGYDYLRALWACRRWLARSKDVEEDVTLQAHAQGLSYQEWQETPERRARRLVVQELVGLLPPHLCKPIFEGTLDIIQDW